MPDDVFERIFETTAAGIAIHEPNTARLKHVNTAYADAFGYSPSELEGSVLTDLATNGQTALSAATERALHDEPEEVELLISADNSTVQVTLELANVSVDGQSRLLSTVRSATEYESQTPPEPSERRLEVALRGTDTGVWEWNLTTDEVIWTESMEQLFGIEPGTFPGTYEAFTEYIHPEDLPEVQRAVETAVEEGTRLQTEYRIERDDGSRRWVHARGELNETADGPGRMTGIVTDITDRKRGEMALRQQEHHYKKLVERLPEAHYTINERWEITFCNAAVADRLGMSVEDIEGNQLWDVQPGAKGTVVESSFRNVMETGEPVNFQYEYGDNMVRIQAYPYKDGVAAVSTDISDQREALLHILDNTPIMLYRFDSDGIFQDVRGQVVSRLGIEPADILGESIFEVYAGHEDIITAARRALNGESFRHTITLGDVMLETNYTPVYEDGEVTSVIGVSMDVTETHQQRERMEFFHSILRHDVLNGMTVIKMRGQLLANELEGDQQRHAQTIVDYCDTTTEVTQRVRRVIETLTTPDEEQALAPVDVAAILKRKHAQLANAYPNVEFATSIPANISVKADELLADVLGNVLTNSIEHNDPDTLHVDISVECTGDTVQIRIADDGVGITDERKETVFRRGETSHAKETGSGFGLFFVDVMIEKYGGTIWVRDSASGGACFDIELSAAAESYPQ